MKRTPFGQNKVRYQAEREQSVAFEELLYLHRVDFWHDNLPMRNKAGFPDYILLGEGWHAFVELKAVSPTTGRRGRLTAEQIAFHDRLRKGDAEVMVFVLPTDLEEANEWLTSKTGIKAKIQ